MLRHTYRADRGPGARASWNRSLVVRAVLRADPHRVQPAYEAGSGKSRTALADLCRWVLRLAAAQSQLATLTMIESEQGACVELSCKVGTNADARLYVQRVRLDAVEALGGYQLARSFCRRARRALADVEDSARSDMRSGR